MEELESNIDFKGLLSVKLKEEEEFVVESFYEENTIGLVLSDKKIAVVMRMRPWVSFIEIARRIAQTLIGITECFVMGYELDFDIHNVNKSLDEMKANPHYHPFLLKRGVESKIEIIGTMNYKTQESQLKKLKESLAELNISLDSQSELG